MGIRSDVVVCMKSEIYKKLSDESRHFLQHNARLAEPEPEGIGFIFEDIKWYRYSGDTEIEKLYSDLADLDGEGIIDTEDYIIIEACPEYPSHDSDGDEGAWWDNPWGFRKEISVSIDGI